MIKENDIYSLIHYEYGLPYSGDYNGMRYRIARNPLERVFGKKKKEKQHLKPQYGRDRLHLIQQLKKNNKRISFYGRRKIRTCGMA